MSSINKFQDLINIINARFELLDETREKAIQLNRQLLRISINAITLINKGKIDSVKEYLKDANMLIQKIYELLNRLGPEDNIYILKVVSEGIREYVEATLLYSYFSGEDLLDINYLIRFGPTPIIEGFFDFIGELRRFFLGLLIENEIEKAKSIIDYIKKIYNILLMLNIKNYYISSFKRRFDILRSQLDKCLEDYNFALRRKGT